MSRVLELVNAASGAVDANEKVGILHRLKELLLECTPLPSVQEYKVAMDGIVAMATERNVNVAKTILLLIEDAMEPNRNSQIKLAPILAQTRFSLLEAIGIILTINAGPSVIRKAMKLLDKYTTPIVYHIWIEPLDPLDESIWHKLLELIQILEQMIEQLQDAEAVLLATRVLETCAFHLSYARDSIHRDPARSNIQPDALHLGSIPSSHRFAQPQQLAGFGTNIIYALTNRLTNAPRHPMLAFGRREYVTLIHSLSLLSCLRTEFATIVVPCFLNLHATIETLDPRIQDTVVLNMKANLIKLLRLPLPAPLPNDITTALIAMDASTRAFEAISKSKEKRRTYGAAPSDASLKNFKRDDAKRTMQFEASTAKRFKREVQVEKPVAITTESLVNLPSDQVVDFVLMNMSNLPSVVPLNAKGEKLELLHTPSALKDRITGILSTLATPSSVLALAMNAKKTAAQRRDPRRRNNVATDAPSLLHIFDENSLDSVTNIVCANSQTLVEPIISVTKDEVTREYNAIRVNIKPVTDEWCRQMALLTISRMLENEYGILTSGHEKLREALVCRLATSRWLLEESARDSKSVHKQIVDFVGEQLHKRHMILVSLVYHEYTRTLYDTMATSSQASYPRYTGLLKLICSMLQARLDPNIASDKKLYYSILSHIPRLTEDVLKMMVAQLVDATDNQRLVMGVSAIRNYIMDRSMGQEACLNILLHFAAHMEEAIRNLTIRCLANQIYPLPKMHGLIEAYAIQLMESLCLAQEETKEQEDEPMGMENHENTSSPTLDAEEKQPAISVSSRRQYYLKHIQLATDEDQSLLTYAKTLQKEHDFSEAPESEQHVLQRMELFLALCAKKPDLFSRFVTTYGKASPPVQHVLVNSVDKLIRHLKQREGDQVVLAQLQPFAPAALDFVVHIVRLLVSLSREPSTLVDPVVQLYQNHQDIPESISLLIPIVSEMPTDVFLPLLPLFFTLPHARLTETMGKLLAPIPLKVDPTALLLALHHIPDEAERQKSVLKAIGMCLEHPAVFTADVFQSVIATLFQEDPIPKFTLRTMIQAVQLYPKLRKPMATNMEILVSREIWAMDETLWKGFMKGAVVVQPHSFPILLTLPLPQGQSILEMDEGKDLVEPFKAFCSKEANVPEHWRTYLELSLVQAEDETKTEDN